MITSKISNRLEVCEEALLFSQELLEKGKSAELTSLLQDVRVLTSSMTEEMKKEEGKSTISHNIVLCCLNMENSLKRFFSMPHKGRQIFYYEILESFRRIKYLVYLQHEVLSNDETLNHYRKQLMQKVEGAHAHRLENMGYKYKVSIVVFAYNKLEYTKRAIESIFKYTDFSKGDIELITVNNGSTDGTEEYFDSLPHEKKLNFKHNMLGVAVTPPICEGKYVVGFSNDVIATPHWLEQLLFCIESSPDIAEVVPTCNEEAISSLQGISVPYPNSFSSVKSIEKFAEKYNQSNDVFWENRVVLMPFVSIWRNDILSIGITDPSYTKIQFVDDDYSTVLRRTGWRMVLAKDTFLHHFGSITLGDSKVVSNQNSLDEMRKVYFNKWGVDAWESRGLLGIEHTFQWISPKKGSRILWIEPKFGADFLSMKNYYRKNGCDDVKADSMVVDSRYLPDAKYYFDRCIPAKDLLQTVSEVQDGYDLIGMSTCLHEVLDGSAVVLLEKLYGILKPGGQLLVPVKNWNSASCLKEIITSGGVHPWGCPANTFKGLSMWGLLESLSQHKYLKKYSRLVVTEADKKLCKSMHSKLAKMFSDVYDSDTFETILQVNMMWLRFQKN